MDTAIIARMEQDHEPSAAGLIQPHKARVVQRGTLNDRVELDALEAEGTELIDDSFHILTILMNGAEGDESVGILCRGLCKKGVDLRHLIGSCGDRMDNAFFNARPITPFDQILRHAGAFGGLDAEKSFRVRPRLVGDLGGVDVTMEIKNSLHRVYPFLI